MPIDFRHKRRKIGRCSIFWVNLFWPGNSLDTLGCNLASVEELVDGAWVEAATLETKRAFYDTVALPKGLACVEDFRSRQIFTYNPTSEIQL